MSPSTNNLGAIHKGVLMKEQQQHHQQSFQPHESLQRQRISLQAQLEACRTCQFTTVGDVLRRKQQQQQEHDQRPYLASGGASRSTDNNNDSLIQSALADHEVALQQQAIRKFRKVESGYRLAGISMPSLVVDSEVMPLRFDIAVDGIYQHCWFVFLQVLQTHHGQLYLRIKQHVVPQDIPFTDIANRTLLPTTTSLGPCNRPNEWKVEELTKALRAFSQEIYQACYCHAVRQHDCDTLSRWAKEKTATPLRDHDATMEELQPQLTSHRTLSFQLVWHKQTGNKVGIELVYDDPMRWQPTSVTVQRSPESRRSNHQRSVRRMAQVSDDEADDDDKERDEFIVASTKALLRLRLPGAVEEIVKLAPSLLN